MHISIPDDLKKQFHAACALRGLKMSQVVVELIKQWLASEAQSVGELNR
jgi:antitoxin component of RelBE/YafQ-DinJ toxin-antitoxin module